MSPSRSAARLPLAAAILAAGESRRMGTPKALLPYRGKNFAEHLLEVTNHERVGMRRIVVGAHAEEISSNVRSGSAEIVINQEWQSGQLSSIQAAIRSLPSGETSGLLLCPVDHPLVSAELVAQLIEAFDASGKLVVLPAYEGKRGHPLIFAEALYQEILAASPEVGARQVVWAHATDVLEVPTDEEGVVLNLNDPETLRRAMEAP
ncbi:MAG: nucleotidyltransferase family protein [Candidatus Acidiferrales bacterium]